MRVKTRPLNNDHCFEGTGVDIWREKARGMNLSRDIFRNSTDGYILDYKLDSDHAALQTGGIESPREYKLEANTYRRFISTAAHSDNGGIQGILGNWWLREDDFQLLCVTAKQRNEELANFAAQALYIPAGWGDCGYVLQARLNTPLRAWAGRGKIASDDVSPDAARRQNSMEIVYGMPGISEHIMQLLIPEPYHFDESGRNRISFFTLLSCESAWNR